MSSSDRRAPLIKQLHELEDKLAALPPLSDALTAAESVEHCALQRDYWRLSQMIASMLWTDTTLDGNDRVEHRKWMEACSEQAGEWEKRKSVAQKNLIDDRLAELQDRLKFLLAAGDVLEEEDLVT